MDISYLGDRWLAVVAAVVLLHTSSANGQAGGSYDVRRSAIEGGGVTVASGGSYRIGGTIGQPVAGTASGGSHFLGAGFWGGAGGMAAPTVTVTVRITPMATVSPLSTGTATAVPTVPSRTPTPSPTVIAATSTPNGSPAAPPLADWLAALTRKHDDVVRRLADSLHSSHNDGHSDRTDANPNAAAVWRWQLRRASRRRGLGRPRRAHRTC